MDVELEKRFFERHLLLLPSPYTSLCSNRMTLLYFTLTALDCIDRLPDSPTALSIAKWVKAQLVSHDDRGTRGGFRGGSSLGLPFDPTGDHSQSLPHRYDEGHIAMTYTALAILAVLDENRDDIEATSIITSLKALQRPNGSFAPIHHSDETDTRFVFCACAISTFLDDWSGVDRSAATQFIISCISFEGGFGLNPGGEATGGSSYVAVAALQLMGTLDQLSKRQRSRLTHWCINRQGDGYTGRTNKPPDTCYSFWVGAVVEMLGMSAMTAPIRNRAFNLTCKTLCGGFGKYPDCDPDLLHSLYGTVGLCFMQLDQDALQPFDATLGVTTRSSRTLHH